VSLQDNRAINASYGTLPMNLVGVTENRSVSGCNGVVELNIFSECYASGTYNDKQFNRGKTVTFQAAPGAAGYKGDWNHVDVYLQINSIAGGRGVPDGVVQYWFNGRLIIDRHDVLFRAGARTDLKFAQFVIGPYIGGNGSPVDQTCARTDLKFAQFVIGPYIGGNGSPVDQTMWVDNLTLATGRP